MVSPAPLIGALAAGIKEERDGEDLLTIVEQSNVNIENVDYLRNVNIQNVRNENYLRNVGYLRKLDVEEEIKKSMLK